ncbi:uncharacterized protein [Diadema antillarum]|uniref:uncharacterized protein n=1 Tax=Diadema antillarum TaxID=105358 RepID=UPI003A85DEA2
MDVDGQGPERNGHVGNEHLRGSDSVMISRFTENRNLQCFLPKVRLTCIRNILESSNGHASEPCRDMSETSCAMPRCTKVSSCKECFDLGDSCQQMGNVRKVADQNVDKSAGLFSDDITTSHVEMGEQSNESIPASGKTHSQKSGKRKRVSHIEHLTSIAYKWSKLRQSTISKPSPSKHETSDVPQPKRKRGRPRKIQPESDQHSGKRSFHGTSYSDIDITAKGTCQKQPRSTYSFVRYPGVAQVEPDGISGKNVVSAGVQSKVSVPNQGGFLLPKKSPDSAKVIVLQKRKRGRPPKRKRNQLQDGQQCQRRDTFPLPDDSTESKLTYLHQQLGQESRFSSDNMVLSELAAHRLENKLSLQEMHSSEESDIHSKSLHDNNKMRKLCADTDEANDVAVIREWEGAHDINNVDENDETQLMCLTPPSSNEQCLPVSDDKCQYSQLPDTIPSDSSPCVSINVDSTTSITNQGAVETDADRVPIINAESMSSAKLLSQNVSATDESASSAGYHSSDINHNDRTPSVHMESNDSEIFSCVKDAQQEAIKGSKGFSNLRIARTFTLCGAASTDTVSFSDRSASTEINKLPNCSAVWNSYMANATNDMSLKQVKERGNIFEALKESLNRTKYPNKGEMLSKEVLLPSKTDSSSKEYKSETEGIGKGERDVDLDIPQLEAYGGSECMHDLCSPGSDSLPVLEKENILCSDKNEDEIELKAISDTHCEVAPSQKDSTYYAGDGVGMVSEEICPNICDVSDTTQLTANDDTENPLFASTCVETFTCGEEDEDEFEFETPDDRKSCKDNDQPECEDPEISISNHTVYSPVLQSHISSSHEETQSESEEVHASVLHLTPVQPPVRNDSLQTSFAESNKDQAHDLLPMTSTPPSPSALQCTREPVSEDFLSSAKTEGQLVGDEFDMEELSETRSIQSAEDASATDLDDTCGINNCINRNGKHCMEDPVEKEPPCHHRNEQHYEVHLRGDYISCVGETVHEELILDENKDVHRGGISNATGEQIAHSVGVPAHDNDPRNTNTRGEEQCKTDMEDPVALTGISQEMGSMPDNTLCEAHNNDPHDTETRGEKQCETDLDNHVPLTGISQEMHSMPDDTVCEAEEKAVHSLGLSATSDCSFVPGMVVNVGEATRAGPEVEDKIIRTHGDSSEIARSADTQQHKCDSPISNGGVLAEDTDSILKSKTPLASITVYGQHDQPHNSLMKTQVDFEIQSVAGMHEATLNIQEETVEMGEDIEGSLKGNPSSDLPNQPLQEESHFEINKDIGCDEISEEKFKLMSYIFNKTHPECSVEADLPKSSWNSESESEVKSAHIAEVCESQREASLENIVKTEHVEPSWMLEKGQEAVSVVKLLEPLCKDSFDVAAEVNVAEYHDDDDVLSTASSENATVPYPCGDIEELDFEDEQSQGLDLSSITQLPSSPMRCQEMSNSPVSVEEIDSLSPTCPTESTMKAHNTKSRNNKHYPYTKQQNFEMPKEENKRGAPSGTAHELPEKLGEGMPGSSAQTSSETELHENSTKTPKPFKDTHKEQSKDVSLGSKPSNVREPKEEEVESEMFSPNSLSSKGANSNSHQTYLAKTEESLSEAVSILRNTTPEMHKLSVIKSEEKSPGNASESIMACTGESEVTVKKDPEAKRDQQDIASSPKDISTNLSPTLHPEVIPKKKESLCEENFLEVQSKNSVDATTIMCESKKDENTESRGPDVEEMDLANSVAVKEEVDAEDMSKLSCPVRNEDTTCSPNSITTCSLSSGSTAVISDPEESAQASHSSERQVHTDCTGNKALGAQCSLDVTVMSKCMDAPAVNMSLQSNGQHEVQSHSNGQHEVQSHSNGQHEVQSHSNGQHEIQSQSNGRHEIQGQSNGRHDVQNHFNKDRVQTKMKATTFFGEPRKPTVRQKESPLARNLSMPYHMMPVSQQYSHYPMSQIPAQVINQLKLNNSAPSLECQELRQLLTANGSISASHANLIMNEQLVAMAADPVSQQMSGKREHTVVGNHVSERFIAEKQLAALRRQSVQRKHANARIRLQGSGIAESGLNDKRFLPHPHFSKYAGKGASVQQTDSLVHLHRHQTDAAQISDLGRRNLNTIPSSDVSTHHSGMNFPSAYVRTSQGTYLIRTADNIPPQNSQDEPVPCMPVFHPSHDVNHSMQHGADGLSVPLVNLNTLYNHDAVISGRTSLNAGRKRQWTRHYPSQHKNLSRSEILRQQAINEQGRFSLIENRGGLTEKSSPGKSELERDIMLQELRRLHSEQDEKARQAIFEKLSQVHAYDIFRAKDAIQSDPVVHSAQLFPKNTAMVDSSNHIVQRPSQESSAVGLMQTALFFPNHDSKTPCSSPCYREMPSEWPHQTMSPAITPQPSRTPTSWTSVTPPVTPLRSENLAAASSPVSPASLNGMGSTNNSQIEDDVPLDLTLKSNTRRSHDTPRDISLPLDLSMALKNSALLGHGGGDEQDDLLQVAIDHREKNLDLNSGGTSSCDILVSEPEQSSNVCHTASDACHDVLASVTGRRESTESDVSLSAPMAQSRCDLLRRHVQIGHQIALPCSRSHVQLHTVQEPLSYVDLSRKGFTCEGPGLAITRSLNSGIPLTQSTTLQSLLHSKAYLEHAKGNLHIDPKELIELKESMQTCATGNQLSSDNRPHDEGMRDRHTPPSNSPQSTQFQSALGKKFASPESSPKKPDGILHPSHQPIQDDTSLGSVTAENAFVQSNVEDLTVRSDPAKIVQTSSGAVMHCPKKRYKLALAASLSGTPQSGTTEKQLDGKDFSVLPTHLEVAVHSDFSPESRSQPARKDGKTEHVGAPVIRRCRGRPRGSSKQRNKLVNEYYNTLKCETVIQQCHFCEFTASSKQELRCHQNQAHFAKYIIKPGNRKKDCMTVDV